MWLPCVACTTIPSFHSRTAPTVQCQAVRISSVMSAPPAFLFGRSVSAPFSRGLRLGRGCVPLGNVGRQGRACGPPSLALLQGGMAVEECYASRQMPPCTETGNARLETAARCMCPRSVLHQPSQRAASAIAPQSLREVKSVPSGSEKCKVQSEKWSLREVKSVPVGSEK